MSLARTILLFLTVIFAAQIVYYYGSLPETIATHFDGAGKPDNWSAKQIFLWLMILIGIFAAGFSFWVMFLIEKLPVSWLNLPNKYYWLTGERREESLKRFRTQFEWFSVALMTTLTTVFYLVIQANLTRHPLTSFIWLVLIGHIIFVIIWLIQFVRRFKIPK